MTPETKARNTQQQEAARLERDLVQQAYKAGDQQAAHDILFQVLDRLSSYFGYPECDALFVSTAIELSTLCFMLGRSFSEIFIYLQTALAAAERLGDRRSQAMIKLHLGRIYYFREQRLDAMRAFSEGKAIVEELGDQDILIQAGEFLGLYFHMQGLFREAKEYFELAVSSYEAGGENQLINPSAAMWTCYCEAYLGQFHRAIGRLDYYRRIAIEKSDQNLATTLRAVLGLVLLMIKKLQEAFFHLSGALQEALSNKNALAHYFAQGGLGILNLYQGRPEKARDLYAQGLVLASEAGLVRQYASPIDLEMLYEFERLGLDPISNFSFKREVVRVMNEPNIHLKAVAFRLQAMKASETDKANATVQADLEASEDLLIRCGDPIQLGKTRVELARLKLKENNQEKARFFAQQAWKDFSGYVDEFYPDDLRHLLDSGDYHLLGWDTPNEFLTRFMEIIEELLPSGDINKLLARAVAATNKFFGAERGGLFWFSRRKSGQNPVLRAACNLSTNEVYAENFRSNLALIFKAFREKEPQLVRLDSTSPHQVKAMLCLPFEVEGQTRGVLYQDNLYLKDCFEFFDNEQLRKMASYLTNYIDHVWAFSRGLEERSLSVSKNIINKEVPNSPEILTQSPVMKKILAQADKIAASDSTVLILGETGVGKELLSHRIHVMSNRNEGPFVVVDPATIPENLVESELFGHEKGAFTGADRRKKGRMELAHRGTLFIDEVGEIPKTIQVKLLRALQEKTLVRVGGTQTLSSDFRLITATNRDLAEEAAAGRFREDLYYRLNVVPLTLIPLRERREDVPLLAQHFLAQYASKYNRPHLKLTPVDEAELMHYHWPGNVRELLNVIQRAVILSTGERLDLNLPTGIATSSDHLIADNPTLDELQRRYIKSTLRKTGGKISGSGGAAELLGMKRSTLYNRMKKLGIG
jgi:transcriptional regulator with GAF, ATPase, and Fis domain/tetratricopeptide (TPR) repeat protein